MWVRGVYGLWVFESFLVGGGLGRWEIRVFVEGLRVSFLDLVGGRSCCLFEI